MNTTDDWKEFERRVLGPAGVSEIGKMIVKAAFYAGRASMLEEIVRQALGGKTPEETAKYLLRCREEVQDYVDELIGR